MQFFVKMTFDRNQTNAVSTFSLENIFFISKTLISLVV